MKDNDPTEPKQGLSDGAKNKEAIDDKIDSIIVSYNKQVGKTVSGAVASGSATLTSRQSGDQPKSFYKEVQSNSFDAENLQRVVDEIKVIEDGIKALIAKRTKKIVEERVPVERNKPKDYGKVGKLMVALGLKAQEMETVTDYKVVRKEVPRRAEEVVINEFRGMIDKYIASLKGLNDGLRSTVVEVDAIVRNLTEVSDAFTDQIHHDRRAYHQQIQISRELEKQLNEIIPIHESMSPIHDRFAEVEKTRDHIEMALRDSQGMELKYKTKIDMGVRYQAALKSYRTLINDFKERGDIHVNMVDSFAEGASHMKIAVENVSQICSGVAKVTQSMIMIVESIEGGNKVLGRYAALIGDQISSSPQWQMEYNALKEAEQVYKKNDDERLLQIEGNRSEIEKIVETSRQVVLKNS
jgi:hypothetical protein